MQFRIKIFTLIKETKYALLKIAGNMNLFKKEIMIFVTNLKWGKYLLWKYAFRKIK